MARIDDYKKELAYWKDTIRKLLYQSGTNKQDASKIFYMVTKALGSFGINYTDYHFEDIANLAERITEKSTGIKDKILSDE